MPHSTPFAASPREDTLRFLRAFARTYDSPERNEDEARQAATLLAGELQSASC